MVKKIIITGGLGYIGTELCKIYSGFSWYHKILVIDNRFISERVNQIRKWNMEFIQGDILDKNLVKKYFKDADIVHHLAGITEVPRTKSESTKEKDEKIRLVSSGAIILAFFVNRAGQPIDDLQQVITECIGYAMALILFIQGIPDSILQANNREEDIMNSMVSRLINDIKKKRNALLHQINKIPH